MNPLDALVKQTFLTFCFLVNDIESNDCITSKPLPLETSRHTPPFHQWLNTVPSLVSYFKMNNGTSRRDDQTTNKFPARGAREIVSAFPDSIEFRFRA